jgi:predicted ArsR family transcriptional regulator
MTASNAILRDLRSGQSTAGALADRLRIDPSHAEALLNRHETDGLVRHDFIGAIQPNPLKVYALTDKGRQA